ncbi:MAG: PEP-CTERM sorting domain-containing protein [Verrucomicrobiota bacterium]
MRLLNTTPYLATVGLLCAALSGVAQGQITFNIPNNSFQDPDTNFFTPGDPPGWSYVYEGGIAPPNGHGVQTTDTGYTGTAITDWDQDQLAYMNIAVGDSAYFQSASAVGTFQAGLIYTVEFLVGLRPDNSDAANEVSFEIGLVDLDTNTEVGTFATLTPTAGNSVQELQYTLNVSAEAAGSIGNDFGVRIRGNNDTVTDPGQYQLNFDNARVSAVPEPASSALLLGAAGLLALRRRRAL